MLGRFMRVVAHRAPAVSVLAVLDRQMDTGRWHVHALVLAPVTFEPAKLPKSPSRL